MSSLPEACYDTCSSPSPPIESHALRRTTSYIHRKSSNARNRWTLTRQPQLYRKLDTDKAAINEPCSVISSATRSTPIFSQIFSRRIVRRSCSIQAVQLNAAPSDKEASFVNPVLLACTGFVQVPFWPTQRWFWQVHDDSAPRRQILLTHTDNAWRGRQIFYIK